MTKIEFLHKLGMELGVKGDALADSTSLSSIAAWDSMGRMAVLAMIDSELNYTLPPNTLQNCQTVADLVAAVHQKLTP